MLERGQIPVVEVMDISENPIDINIGFSHYKVGVSVAEYLSTKGYREIAYAGTLTEVDSRSVKRISGFQENPRKAGTLSPSHSAKHGTFIDRARLQFAGRVAQEASASGGGLLRQR